MGKNVKNKRGLELQKARRSSGYKTSVDKFIYLLCITWPSSM